MKGTCAECKEMQKHKGMEDYCCAKCTLTFGGLGDYMTTDKHGTVIVDLEQKIKDKAKAGATVKCPDCKRRFPEHLIQPMFINGGYKSVCPLCALLIRNRLHGMPDDKPFGGEMANALWEEADKLYPKKGGR